jgi:hypothetical protein
MADKGWLRRFDETRFAAKRLIQQLLQHCSTAGCFNAR